MTQRRTRPVWRLFLLWQGTVLDVHSVAHDGVVALRTGERIQVRVIPDGVVVESGGLSAVLDDDASVTLSSGPTLLARRDAPAAALRAPLQVDSTFLHAAMIGAAVQVCVVSALLLTPPRVVDPDAGSGWLSDLRRRVATPGGTAIVVGRPTFAPVGRPVVDGERPQAIRPRGERASSSHSGRGPTLEQALEAMQRALHPGSDGGDLREALGELTSAQAQAPALGAGVGGLSPRDPVDSGAGTGLIGPGTSRIAQVLRERLQRLERHDVAPPPHVEARVVPVQLQDVPDGDVASGAATSEEALDPFVREQLLRAIRQRHNAIRACYEAWGLAGDARRSGRIVVGLTLTPGGHVEDVDVDVSDTAMQHVASCVKRAAVDWYLGDGLVDEPTRLAFPFTLQPRASVSSGATR